MQPTPSPSIPKPPEPHRSWIDYAIYCFDGAIDEPSETSYACAELDSLHARLAEAERERDDANRRVKRLEDLVLDNMDPMDATKADGDEYAAIYAARLAADAALGRAK